MQSHKEAFEVIQVIFGRRDEKWDKKYNRRKNGKIACKTKRK